MEFDPSLLTDTFSEEQSKVLLNVLKSVDETVSDKVMDALKEAGLSDDSMFKASPTILKDQKRLNTARQIWKNNGFLDGVDGRISYTELAEKDLEFAKDFTSQDQPLLIPRVIAQEVREALEPNLVLTPLLQKINFSAGTQITFPAAGAMSAADIPEGGEYPERSLEFAGTVVATIGKSGIAVKFTDEMIKYSLFDVMNIHLRAAGRALARWKEEKVASLILDNGSVLYDNASASYASTTGRNASGAYNGTLTLHDFFRGWAQMINLGFTPDTLIMNPFGWTIFAEEGLARLFGFANGGALWGQMQGSPGKAPWTTSDPRQRKTVATAPENLATTYTNVPSMFPATFKIVVSPYIPVDTANNLTHIILADSNELGILVVDEDVMTEDFRDPMRDIQKVKLRERYGLAVLNEGQGIGLFKNISLARGFDFASTISAQYDLGSGEFTGYPLSGDDGYSAAINGGIS